MKKSFKAITLSLAVFSTLTLFNSEKASAVSPSESKQFVFNEPVASTKTIVLNNKARVGHHFGIYSLPVSRFTITGDLFAIEVEERSPNHTWMRAVSPGKVTIFYRNSQGELVIRNVTITF
ncbi:hypothetical protein QGQ84_13055 [Bacillus safensis]|uniref:hypothetical protein n=1 Tax=Bacillus safensis TaxID=561879 RepID=UPI0022AB9724|nr:hypothetical protein [Bacillus safensis]MDI0274516.1 hypothetical protein [Bacillus safensis]WAT81945.1 hypothetical protein O0R49_06205 [Bacillus safensis]